MYGNSDTPLSIRLAKTFYDYLPPAVTEAASSTYFSYLSLQADRQHSPPSDGNLRLAADAPDHVLLLVVDALRPDYVPDISIPFTYAIAPSTWTFPSVTSMHTGLYPHEHGAVTHTRPDDDEFAMPRQMVGRPTLAGRLEAAGYDTYCGCSFLVPFTTIRGWYRTHRVYGNGDAETILLDYLSWRDGREKTFGYVHLGDLHGPIRPPEEYLATRGVDPDAPAYPDEPCVAFDGCGECRTLREKRVARYQAAFDYLTDCLRKLVDTVAEDTLLIVTGDHGEGQGEHYEHANRFTDSRPNGGKGIRGNVGHGGTPFDVVARVPVGVSHPDGRSLLPDGGWASLCDVPATVLAETVADPGITRGNRWQTGIPEDRAALSEAVRFGAERKAVYRGERKAIRSKADDVTLTANVDFDEPGERFRPVSASERQELLEPMPDEWEDFDASTAVGPLVKEQLNALGYT